MSAHQYHHYTHTLIHIIHTGLHQGQEKEDELKTMLLPDCCCLYLLRPNTSHGNGDYHPIGIVARHPAIKTHSVHALAKATIGSVHPWTHRHHLRTLAHPAPPSSTPLHPLQPSS